MHYKHYELGLNFYSKMGTNGLNLCESQIRVGYEIKTNLAISDYPSF